MRSSCPEVSSILMACTPWCVSIGWASLRVQVGRYSRMTWTMRVRSPAYVLQHTLIHKVLPLHLSNAYEVGG